MSDTLNTLGYINVDKSNPIDQFDQMVWSTLRKTDGSD